MGLLKGSVLTLGLLAVLLLQTAQAQLLPNNQALNAQSVQRWMNSNRAMASSMQLLDAMHNSAEEMARFELLPAAEQDRRIARFLQERGLLASVQASAEQLGWKSLGEYQRLGTRLGNAIAAYFLLQDSARLAESERQALLDNADPAIRAVPAADIAFVRTNEAALQQYIQAYGAGL